MLLSLTENAGREELRRRMSGERGERDSGKCGRVSALSNSVDGLGDLSASKSENAHVVSELRDESEVETHSVVGRLRHAHRISLSSHRSAHWRASEVLVDGRSGLNSVEQPSSRSSLSSTAVLTVLRPRSIRYALEATTLLPSIIPSALLRRLSSSLTHFPRISLDTAQRSAKDILNSRRRATVVVLLSRCCWCCWCWRRRSWVVLVLRGEKPCDE